MGVQARNLLLLLLAADDGQGATPVDALVVRHDKVGQVCEMSITLETNFQPAFTTGFRARWTWCRGGGADARGPWCAGLRSAVSTRDPRTLEHSIFPTLYYAFG